MDEEPAYIVQRQPYPDKGYTYYHVWVKDEEIDVSSSQLGQILGDTIQAHLTNKK